MELYQLRTFVTVAREGHLTRAANLLFISQPAVSAHIKALEDELGVKLFERTPKGMALTAAGELLRTQAERALEAAQDVLDQASRLKGELHGTLRLGTISEPVALRLGEFLSALVAAHPGLEVQLQQGVSGTVLDEVRAGRLDGGYVLEDAPDATLGWVRLADVSLQVVGPAGWAESFRAATWQEVLERPWVGTPPACSFHRIAEQLFRAQGQRPTIVAVADQERTLRSLVAAGVGATLLREDQAAAAIQAGEAVRWPGAEHRTGLWFVYPRHRVDEPTLQALIGFVRRTWDLPGDPATP